MCVFSDSRVIYALRYIAMQFKHLHCNVLQTQLYIYIAQIQKCSIFLKHAI